MDIDINLTYRCPLRCKYCSIEKGPGKEAPWQSWAETVGDFNRIEQVELVSLEGGEPLLFKDILDLVDSILNEVVRVKIITSGAVSLQALALSHRKNPRVIVEISIDGRKETHNILRDGSFDRAWESLSLLLNTDMGVTVRTVLSSRNINDYLPLLGEIDSLVASARRNITVFFDVIIAPEHLLAAGAVKKQRLREYPTSILVPSANKITSLYRLLKTQPFRNLCFDQDEPFRGCSFGKKNFVSISPSGDYSFCCEKEESLGNVFIDGATKCYETILQIREKSLCNSCQYLVEDVCNGCGNGTKCGISKPMGYSSCKELIEGEVINDG